MLGNRCKASTLAQSAKWQHPPRSLRSPRSRLRSMAQEEIEDDYLSQVDVRDLKELMEELVTWVISEKRAFHKSGSFEICIDVRLAAKMKPLMDALEERKLVSFIGHGSCTRLTSKQIPADPKIYFIRFQSTKPELLFDPLRRKYLLMPLKIISGVAKASDIVLNFGWATKINKEVIITPALYFLHVEAN